MANVIKTGTQNFFINEDGTISVVYDPYFNSIFMMRNSEGPKIKIGMDKISIQPGGQIVFKFDNQKYIIDDGYRNKMIMAGYLTLNTKDTPGVSACIIHAFKDLSFGEMEIKPSYVSIKEKISCYNITIVIESINKMIERNIKRGELNLPMYPTARGYSKNTSVYFRIYAQKDTCAKVTKSYEELHALCNKMLRSILSSDHYNWNKLRSVNEEPDTKYKFSLHECRNNRTILMWEEDL